MTDNTAAITVLRKRIADIEAEAGYPAVLRASILRYAPVVHDGAGEELGLSNEDMAIRNYAREAYKAIPFAGSKEEALDFFTAFIQARLAMGKGNRPFISFMYEDEVDNEESLTYSDEKVEDMFFTRLVQHIGISGRPVKRAQRLSGNGGPTQH